MKKQLDIERRLGWELKIEIILALMNELKSYLFLLKLNISIDLIKI